MTYLKKECQMMLALRNQPKLALDLMGSLTVVSVDLSGTTPGRGMDTCQAARGRPRPVVSTSILPARHHQLQTFNMQLLLPLNLPAILEDKQGCRPSLMRLLTRFLLRSHHHFPVISAIEHFQQLEAGAVTKEEFIRKPQPLFQFELVLIPFLF